MENSNSIWNSITRLLIVFPYKDEANDKLFRKALDKILNESNVQFLRLIIEIPENLDKTTLKQHNLMTYISSKDFNFLGKLKDETINQVLAQPYDAMIWFEVDNSKINKLLITAHATWRIGVNITQDNFHVQLTCDSQDHSEIINFTKNSLQKISSYE